MDFITTAERLDSDIKKYGTRMLANHIDNGNNNIEPLTDTYGPTIFNSIQITGHAMLYKIFNNVAVWLINDISEDIYKESIDDYLKFNKSEHGKLVYNAYLQDPEKYLEYFNEELKRIKNKKGLLFVLTEKDKKGLIYKVCYFHETNF